MKLLICLSYLGTNFCGYQVQDNKRTVQGELTRAARELFTYDCDITGCSRTDSGVHANMFCATISKKGEDGLTTKLSPERIILALNAHLPEDIRVYDAYWVDNDFHARYGVKYKEYIYKIYLGDKFSPFMSGRALMYKKRLLEDAVEKMQKAAEQFVGEYDFSAFMSQGSKVQSTVRCVKYANVEKKGDEIIFKVAADGFLYNMVRIMAGTLIAVAEGKIAPDGIADIIASCDRGRAGQTAPPEGLYLNSVVY